MAFPEDIAYLLEYAGLGVRGVNILIGPRAIMPLTGGFSITGSGGAGPEGTHNSPDSPAYVRPSAQVMTKAPTLAASQALALSAYLVLFPVKNRFVNGTWYRQVFMSQSEPFPMGVDDNDKARFAFNLSCVKRLSPATS